MTIEQQQAGRPTSGKVINLSQLQGELAAARVEVGTGLGMAGGMVFTHSAEGEAIDFPEPDQAAVDQVIAAHMAMRAKNDAEYAAEFQNGATTAERKQEIRDITAGLLPREAVPMEGVS